MTFAGIAGDRNERAMRGSQLLGAAIARQLGIIQVAVERPSTPVEGGWSVQLEHARPGLQRLSEEVAKALGQGKLLITLNRCAAGLATLPVVARQHPEAVIVWFDAHGDCNIPATAPAGDHAYLGGMVISGAAGLWDTSLGSGVDMGRVILVGSRDLDAPERDRVDSGELQLVEVGPHMADRLRVLIEGRPVYIHLDCDVMDAGLLPTEFQVSDGLSFDALGQLCSVLAEHVIVGLEVAEYEGEWPDGRPGDPQQLIEALRPILERLLR